MSLIVYRSNLAMRKDYQFWQLCDFTGKKVCAHFPPTDNQLATNPQPVTE